jgi:TPR repeat protein
MCFERGFGVTKDPKRAAEFDQFAASMNHTDRANNFGHYLEHGFGVDHDISKAR